MSLGPTVLLVDDDVDCLAVGQLALEAAGYRVVCCHSRDEALAYLERERPSAIVTDLMMGRIDAGLSLARAVKADPRLLDVPVVVMTAIGSELGYDLRPRSSADLAAMAADAFLSKPVSPAALRQAVDGLIRRSPPASNPCPTGGPG